MISDELYKILFCTNLKINNKKSLTCLKDIFNNIDIIDNDGRHWWDPEYESITHFISIVAEKEYMVDSDYSYNIIYHWFIYNNMRFRYEMGEYSIGDVFKIKVYWYNNNDDVIILDQTFEFTVDTCVDNFPETYQEYCEQLLN